MSTLSQILGSAQIPTDFTTAAVGTDVTVPSSQQARLICKAGGVAWIVAPNISELSKTWYDREDAIVSAKEVTGSVGWFIPTVGQLQNPGYTCRTQWDSFSSALYWSSTEANAPFACRVSFLNGTASSCYKCNALCVRAFRRVTY
jgi:hypothetical protein